ncbi:MAG: hypothetical protein GYA65_12915 [Actinobacteria bacterium]|mgnify:FL=1|jgi:hypothetical protein|nr:inositol-3-phosphate synthase [Acidimicrobiaceae bacterium]MBK9969962.1 inositol-3-phosphate synthase [Acidimicrobiaceae bacterium]NMD25075.1 hypothetical protein [Actinomycetota bacterium]
MPTPTPAPVTIAPADGTLGVLIVGLGAVATTLIAGVELAKRDMAAPVGSLTQMATIRLGKRTDHRAPLIKDFVPLAPLDEATLEPTTWPPESAAPPWAPHATASAPWTSAAKRQQPTSSTKSSPDCTSQQLTTPPQTDDHRSLDGTRTASRGVHSAIIKATKPGHG